MADVCAHTCSTACQLRSDDCYCACVRVLGSVRQGVLACSFAREESFSIDSRGGGRESNIRCIPFFVQARGKEALRSASDAPAVERHVALYCAARHGVRRTPTCVLGVLTLGHFRPVARQ